MRSSHTSRHWSEPLCLVRDKVKWRRGAAALLALAISVAPAPGTAEAHANPAESDPVANSVLETAPDQVTIRFTEPLEPALSGIQVLDSRGTRVDRMDSAVDSDDPRTMSVSVEPLDDGTYTVAWRNVSTVDGHRVRGAFVFSVGEPISPRTSAGLIEQPLLQSPAEPVIRWLVLMGALVLMGGLAFRLLVFRPALEGLESAGISEMRSAVFRNTVLLLWAGLVVFLAASLAQAMLQASLVYESSVLGALTGPFWSLQSDTEWGRLWTLRIGLVLGLAAVIYTIRLRGADRENPLLLALGVALGAGALLLISLTSHAAATVDIRYQALLNDFMHLIAVAVWVGGLISLAVVMPLAFGFLDASERRDLLSALVPRFSLVAGMSVAVVVVTGIYSAWAQVTVMQALVVPYGRALLVKMVLVGLLLAAAAVNLIWIRPRLKGDGRAAWWLRRLVALECLLALLAVLSVGFLTSLEPARQVASREGIGVADRFRFQDTVEGADLTLEIDPGWVGPNSIMVSVQDRLGTPITNATDVRVRFSYLDADLGETPMSADRAGLGRYVVENQTIGIAGAWQAELVVQRPDAFDARTAFRFEVTSDSGGSLAIAPGADTGQTLLGLELGILGLLFLGVGIPLGGWFTRSGVLTMAPGALGVVAGAVLLFNSLGSGKDVPVRNPIPPTEESVTIGMNLYSDNCQQCHGAGGRGDGPSAAGLDPPPADLVVHVPLHPDRALFNFVHDGIQGSAMIGVGDRLSEDEIWHVINYIRTLE